MGIIGNMSPDMESADKTRYTSSEYRGNWGISKTVLLVMVEFVVARLAQIMLGCSPYVSSSTSYH